MSDTFALSADPKRFLQLGSPLLVNIYYLTIIPRLRVGYEMVVANEARRAKLAIITSHPSSVSGIIVYQKKVIKNAMIRFYMPALYL